MCRFPNKTSITINTANGNDVINVGAFTSQLPTLTINGGTGDDQVRMNGNITFAANANLDLDLQNDNASPGTDDIVIASNAVVTLTGTGTATVKASKNLTINTGGSLITQNGNLTVETNQQTTPTTGNFVGIDINGGTLKVTGSGQANVKGKGGDYQYDQVGIQLRNGGIAEGGTSPLTLEGRGGNGSGNNHYGVLVTGTNTKVTSSGGNVSVTGFGGNMANANGQKGIRVAAGGMITAGGNGTVTVTGTGGNASSQNNDGVHLTNGTLTSSGGNVSVTGTGGGAASTIAGRNYGVYVESSGLISAAGTGTVTVQGTGGMGQQGGNLGIYLNASSVTSANGNIQLTGTAGANNSLTSAGQNYGVLLETASLVSAGGTGTVSVQGTSSINSIGQNYGIFIKDLNTKIISNNGNIHLNGRGGSTVGAGETNMGVYLSVNTLISAGGRGTVLIEGEGGNNASSHGIAVSGSVLTNDGTITLTGITGTAPTADYGSYGVIIYSNGNITAGSGKAVIVQGTARASSGADNSGVRVIGSISSTTGGTVTVTGIEGGAGTGIWVEPTGIISTLTNGGNISFITNSIDIQSGAAVNTNAASTVTLRPYTNGVNIDLGAATNPLGGPLSLADAELDRITAGTLQIGNANSGAVTASTAISRTAITAMNLTSSGAVNLNASSLNLNGGNLSINAVGGINPTAAGTDVTVGTASFTSGNDLNIVINGTTVDTDYRQLNVAGSVNLTGLDLILTGSHTPAYGQTFTIVNNDDSDLITGTFNGLDEGATLPNFLGSSLSATISYVGGDGNDAVITVQAAPAPDINLKGNGNTIANGDNTPIGNDFTDLGAVAVTGATITRSFTIENTGVGELNLTGIPDKVTITGAHAGDFTVTVQPTSPVAATTGSTTFEITFNPSAAGLRTATVNIASNDAEVSNYTFAIQGYGGRPFITTWNTTYQPGSQNNGSSITIPTTGTGYNYDADWDNDGIYDEFNLTGTVTHDYGTPGTYSVAIRGAFPRIHFNFLGDKGKIRSIDQWGDIAWTNMEGAFAGCVNLTEQASDAPDLSGVTSLAGMFFQCTALNQDLSNWNTSNIINMTGMFYFASSFNQNLTSWNTQNVISMSGMFAEATAFNGDITTWNTQNVEDLSFMFQNARAFNQPIGGWDTQKVTDMSNLFLDAYAFNQPIGNWKTGNVIYMSDMFWNAKAFNQPIGDWNTEKVFDMSSMFNGALAFNQDISGWKTQNVTYMYAMFANTNIFNSNISNWNTRRR